MSKTGREVALVVVLLPVMAVPVVVTSDRVPVGEGVGVGVGGEGVGVGDGVGV